MPRGSSSPISRLLKTVRAAFLFRHLEDFRDTAYHEAGHAVVARYLGVPVKSLKIDSSGGIVRLDNVIPESRRTGSTKLLQLGIAGEVAEQIKFGRRFEGNRGDLRAFHTLVQGFYGNLRHSIAGSTIATLRREHWDNCHRTLNRPEIWAWVEAVAQASLRHTVLTGDEIDGLRPAEEALAAQGTAPA